ncbi:polyketide synthase [Trichoderma barbatum]
MEITNLERPTYYRPHRFNATHDATTLGHCLHHIFECTARRYPDHIALCCAGTEVSFRELDALANGFAQALTRRGVGRGDLVGVALERSIDLVVILLAVLKAGAAYVPIDPNFPADRISHMMNDARPKLVVVASNVLDALSIWQGPCWNMDEARHGPMMGVDAGNATCSNTQLDSSAEDLAYVIYTSGSTGKPKGVEISHGAVCNLLLSMRRALGFGVGDRLLAITTISFDIAVLELFLPLLSGATTVIAQKHQVKDAGALLDLMRHLDITTMQATPAAWQMLLDAGWLGEPRLAKMLCGGEALTSQLAARLLDCGDSLWNMYGPTEATIWASAWRVGPGQDVLIGDPIANYQLYVLDEDLALAPAGHAGELYIGGAGLARGYRNLPELTQSRFLDNPFHPGQLYRTGDLARFLAPGRLSVLGRIDDQVKIRGYRIELGDVEATIRSHEGILGVVVTSRDDRLVAYCVRSAKAREHRSSLNEMLRGWVSERLPDYMVPALFVELDAFPMTLNGKIDRKALPDPVAAIRPELGPAAEPATDLEHRIVALWSGVLGHGRFGVDDNFFQIGGDSLRLTRVKKELERLLGRPLPVARLFEHYTIRALAAYLVGAGGSVERQMSVRHCHDDEEIAIISMACRLPGGVTTPEAFWELLEGCGDAIADIPGDRWDANAIYDDNPDTPGTSYCRRGGFVGPVDSFDSTLFGISPREARAMDPTHLLMLETCWEGFERAGHTIEQLRGSQTGVFIGVSNVAAYQNQARPLADLDGYAITGSAAGTMSGRVSYVLGLEGPALTVDTACSSSLVSTHLACNALRRGECDMALSGGVTLMLTPGLHVEFSRLRGMSRDGRCRAFAADTDGTGWAEGSTAIVLKRLSDARRDGDVIHAVLRGTAVNHGGRSASMTTPSGPAQQRLIRTALAESRLRPSDIDYVEAHGTGTKLGDPIEGAALVEVFGGGARADAPAPLFIGSAKSNIGHTQAAAGLVGVIKVVLALNHGALPPTLHAAKPTPLVNWAGVALVQRKQAWPPGEKRLRRAGVSAFGIGGTNAHVIVEEHREQTVGRSAEVDPGPVPLPFLLSGQTNTALRQQAERLRHHVSGGGARREPLAHVAYSLAASRHHFQHRLVLMARDRLDLSEKLAEAARSAASDGSRQTRVAMMFTGQGSQILGMGKMLSQVYIPFRQSMEEIAAHFRGLERPLLDVMWAEPHSQDAILLDRTDFAQPALFTLEVALWRLWQGWGVRPAVVMGHSVGELAAAHAAGILDLPSACRLVEARGRLMQALPARRGAMSSLEASAGEVEAAIELLGHGGEVDIASYNAPMQTVVSGDADAIGRIDAHFAVHGRKAKALKVSHAFHSHHIDAMLADFLTVAQTIRFNPPHVAVVSGLTGKLADPGELQQPAYWVRQAREPVRFSTGIHTLSTLGHGLFVEAGPRPVLSNMGAANLRHEGKAATWLPSLVAGKDDGSVVQGSLAELHVRHVPVDWCSYFQPLGCRRVELPTYAFQRERVVRHDAWPRTPPTETEACSKGPDGGVPDNSRPPEEDLGKTLKDASPERQAAMVLDLVREAVAESLGFASPDRVDVDLSLQEMGIDSLTELLVRGALAATIGQIPSDSISFDCPNLRSLSQSLLSHLHQQHRTSIKASSANTRSLGAEAAIRGCLEPSLVLDNAAQAGEPVGNAVAVALDRPEPCIKTFQKHRVALSPLHRVLSPALGLVPPNSPPQLFQSAMTFFNSLPWCSRLMQEASPTAGLLPGHGQAIGFVPQCLNPASARHDQFFGNTLGRTHGEVTANGAKAPPIRHMLSLFRPSDSSHIRDLSRPILRVATLFALGDGTSGYEDILHGGLTAALLDESLGVVNELNTALGKTGDPFAAVSVTASLNINYLAPIPVTEAAVCVTAWVESINGRKTMMRGEVTNSKGEKLATSKSVWVAVEAKT